MEDNASSETQQVAVITKIYNEVGAVDTVSVEALT